ncbi:MAG TPA: response regulator [Leptospiraceae bacterium]|nr:response regulator [Leptospiraceae bacterium]HMX33708.1 response regulator [Leptospiraceae bacterium]HMY32913.1 response regulator [Leptospiraceae bacterium]HMZ66074.1 response regulator [Leptospiraceae bacterium]HNA09003.1 response regulator [Leptospiraceae bacterium]
MKIEILIIDDSHEIGEALKLIVEDLGYNSKFFDSSEKALPYFQNELNPIIFLDIFLPNDNGLDLLPAIKNISPFTQVIMMSGESDINSVVSSLKNKASDFLIKPFSVESVKLAVERGIEYHKLLKDNHNYQENLEQDMKFLSSIQKQVISPKIDSDTIYADFHAYSFVSGGFYHLDENENFTRIVFGEIEGNGVTSSFIGLLTLNLLKDIFQTEQSPDRVLSKLNDELYFKINIHTLTAVCIVIDKIKKEIHYSNGGNAIPIVLEKNTERLKYLFTDASNIIGIMPKTEFLTHTFHYSEESLLFLYNSGFIHSINSSQREFEAFLKNIQAKYSENNSFNEIKNLVDSHIAISLTKNPKQNLSFFIYKI